jgi:hypothetical protein
MFLHRKCLLLAVIARLHFACDLTGTLVLCIVAIASAAGIVYQTAVQARCTEANYLHHSSQLARGVYVDEWSIHALPKPVS